MAEVAEGDVVTAGSEVGVEGEGQLVAGEAVDHAFGRALPGTAEGGEAELPGLIGLDEPGLMGDLERGVDHPLDSLGGEA